MADSTISFQVLAEAAHAINLLDLKYRNALPQDKFQILMLIHKAEDELREARLKNIKEQLSTSANDVNALSQIGASIENAATTQNVILSAVKLIATIASL